MGNFMPNGAIESFQLRRAVFASFGEHFYQEHPKGRCCKKKNNEQTKEQKGESAADCRRIESLGRKIADKGMPMMATAPRIRLHEAKGCSLNASFMCSIPDAFKLVMQDACGEKQRSLGEGVGKRIEKHPENRDRGSQAKPDKQETHVLNS